jgi:uncharacterized protein YijF (DUF1287 family)
VTRRRALVLASACLGASAYVATQPASRWPEDGVARLVAAAVAQTMHPVRYDGAYRRIPYPMGDVPPDVGVCTDVVVRGYRGD